MKGKNVTYLDDTFSNEKNYTLRGCSQFQDSKARLYY